MQTVVWLLVTVLLARDVLMDNLQDLMIIDSLLKNYDRRATPTNRMGKEQNMGVFLHTTHCVLISNLWSVLRKSS